MTVRSLALSLALVVVATAAMTLVAMPVFAGAVQNRHIVSKATR